MLASLVGHERKLTMNTNSAAAGRKNTKTEQKKSARTRQTKGYLQKRIKEQVNNNLNILQKQQSLLPFLHSIN